VIDSEKLNGKVVVAMLSIAFWGAGFILSYFGVFNLKLIY